MKYRNVPILGLIEANHRRKKADNIFDRVSAELDATKETVVTIVFLTIVTLFFILVYTGGVVCLAS